MGNLTKGFGLNGSTLVQVARSTDAELLERFIQNEEQTRQEVRQKLGICGMYDFGQNFRTKEINGKIVLSIDFPVVARPSLTPSQYRDYIDGKIIETAGCFIHSVSFF